VSKMTRFFQLIAKLGLMWDETYDHYHDDYFRLYFETCIAY
jgi:hypothetical protein